MVVFDAVCLEKKERRSVSKLFACVCRFYTISCRFSSFVCSVPCTEKRGGFTSSGDSDGYARIRLFAMFDLDYVYLFIG